MTIYKCLEKGETNPAAIAEATSLPLNTVTKELLKLSGLLAKQFAKQFRKGLPKYTPIKGLRRGQLVAKLQAGMTARESQVLDLALCGVLHHVRVAEILEVDPSVVRTCRARMMRLARQPSFERVVDLVISSAK